MKTIIVYYSYSGNNEKLATELKQRIQCDTYKINEMKKRSTLSILFDFLFNRNTKVSSTNINFKEYDKVIFVAPIWGGKVATPIRAFLEREKNILGKYYYITLCSGETGQSVKISNELYSIVQRQPNEVKELWINSLLPKEKQNNIKNTFNFRISKQDLEHFNEEIESFVKVVNESI